MEVERKIGQMLSFPVIVHRLGVQKMYLVVSTLEILMILQISYISFEVKLLPLSLKKRLLGPC